MIETVIDGHVHTALCRHAKGEMEEYVLAAIERGLAGIVFLEHLEIGIRYFERTWLTEDDFVFYRQEAKRLKEKYSGSIEVLCGIEVGYNPNEVARIGDFLAAHPWDRIGISYHFFEVDGRHVNLVSRKQSNLDAVREAGVMRVLEGYYAGLDDAVRQLDGHVVCHLDAALRYLEGLDAASRLEYAYRLLETIAARGIALEVNTSGFAIRGEQFPATPIVSRAASLGIPLWPGSDAHRPEDVGRYFDRVAGLAEQV